jgi:hypothetical protein
MAIVVLLLVAAIAVPAVMLAPTAFLEEDVIIGAAVSAAGSSSWAVSMAA